MLYPNLCYKGTILQWNYRNMTIYGHLPIVPSLNSMVKKYGNHNMTLLYPNLFYNEVVYKGSTLYYQTAQHTSEKDKEAALSKIFWPPNFFSSFSLYGSEFVINVAPTTKVTYGNWATA